MNKFDIDFEHEAQEQEKALLKRASTGPLRRTASRNLKTPSTMERTAANKSVSGNNDLDEEAYTPECFKATACGEGQATDEQGNRCSILPGSSRPSKNRTSSTGKTKAIASFEESKKPSEPKVKKSALEILNEQNAAVKPLKEGEKQQQRTNFVRLNTKMTYKPRIRGAAFTNKIMAKKVNSVKAK